MKFRDALTMGVGTSTGQILLYDLRSNRPTKVKDHRYGLPIKSVDFHHLNHDLVASMDARIVRLWDRNTVKYDNKYPSENLQIISKFLGRSICVSRSHVRFKRFMSRT